MKEQINSFSITSLLLALSGSTYWGISSSYIIFKANTSVVISLILGFLLSLLYCYILLKFFSTLPEESFANKLKKLYGKFSIPLNILLIITTFLLSSTLNYRLAKFLSSQYLIDTPPIYLNTFIIFLITYIATKKTETLTRVSVMSFYICLIVFVLDTLALLPEISLIRLLPILTVPEGNILLSAFIFSVFFSLPCFYINIVNKNKIVNKEKFNKSFMKVYFISFLIHFIIMFSTIGILGIDLMNLLSYPLYSVLKRINVSSFIISIENVGIILWFLYVIVGTSAMFLFIINQIKDTFKIKKEKTLNIILYIIGLIAIIFPNIIFNKSLINTSFKMVIMPTICYLFSIIICLISLITYKIKKKKNTYHSL